MGYFGQATSSVESSSYLLLYTVDSYLKRFNILVILGVLNGFNLWIQYTPYLGWKMSTL